MLKNLMKMATVSILSLMMLSSYWDMPYYGPCMFFFGEPELPNEIRERN